MEVAGRGSGHSRATSGSDTDTESQRQGGTSRVPAEVLHLVTQLVGFVSMTAALHIVQPPRDAPHAHGVGERAQPALGRQPRQSRAGADRPRRSLRSPRRLSGRFEFSPDLVTRLAMFSARIKTMRQLEMCSTSSRRRKAKNRLPHLSPRTSDCVCWKHARDAHGRPAGIGQVKQPHVLTQHSADAHYLHRQRRPQAHGTGRPVVRTTSERVMTKPPLAPHDGTSPRSRRHVFAATAITPMRLVIPPPNEPVGTSSASSTPRGRALVPNKLARQARTSADDSSDDDFSGEPPELVISPLQRHRVILAVPPAQPDDSGAPSPAVAEPHTGTHGPPHDRSTGGVDADNETGTPVPTVVTGPETFACNQSTFTRTMSHVGYTVTSYSPTPIPAPRLWTLPWVPRTAPHSAPHSADNSPLPTATATSDGFMLVHVSARGLHNSRPVQRRQGMTGYRPHGAFRAVAVIKPPV